MTSATPTQAVANLHLHLEYDSGLEVIAQAMRTVPDGEAEADAHRGHITEDLRHAIAHLLDVEAIVPEGSPLRLTEMGIEVEVDLPDHIHDDGEDVNAFDLDEQEVLDAREALRSALGHEGESMQEVMAAYGVTEEALAYLARAGEVIESVGPPPFDVDDTEEVDTASIASFGFEWAVACGVLATACREVMDSLFDDLEVVSRDHLAHQPRSGTVLEGSLPERSEREYTPLFYRRFVATMAGVTTKLAAGWEGPATVAEALAMDYLIDTAESLIEDEDVNVRDEFFDVLRDRLTDLDVLEAVHGDSSPAGDIDMWFVRFDAGLPVAPYATVV
ncbi:hypothetical protein [Microbacterium sp. 77mftsu3.1]|uniref:hypothetical protein n=1 Tax=Microbacterium sp. 77mftsu3.1 TaxID=1761802 RepID=UPI0003822C13|nr:hypothetical protein [Microbacterium sp. 77mftsu3.1]SDH56344.1 hypothetical protein SAMN04488590_3588 [Microbacterium sp. 77mftsu3.1]